MSVLAPTLFDFLQAAADTSATRFVVERSWLDTLANIAQSLVSILIMVMLVMGVLLLYALRKSIDELSRLVRSANTPLQAAITEARQVTGEIRGIAASLKAPLALAGETIEEATERAQDAMDAVEGRLARFDALVGIAQEEAEGAVVGAASLLRGVRASGGVVSEVLGLSRSARRKRRRARNERARSERSRDERTREGEIGDARESDDERGAPRRARVVRASRADANDANLANDADNEAEAPRIRSRSAAHS